MASDILSYNVVQDHEGISIKGYRGLRPQGDRKGILSWQFKKGN